MRPIHMELEISYREDDGSCRSGARSRPLPLDRLSLLVRC